MPKQPFQIEDLKKWQNHILEYAKKNLRKDDSLRPVAFILTEKMNIEESVMHYLASLAPKDPRIDDVAPSDTVLIILDLVLGPEQTLSVIRSYMPPEEAAIITALEQKGYEFGAKNPAAIVSRALMEELKLHEKDIVVMAIEYIIKKTDAIAYIKLDETWMVRAKLEERDDVDKYTGRLEDHPKAIEAITSFLETDDYVRMVSIPFHRNRPKTGRVIGFDEPMEIVESADSTPEQKLSGRYTHIFKKAKAGAKPAASPNAN